MFEECGEKEKFIEYVDLMFGGNFELAESFARAQGCGDEDKKINNVLRDIFLKEASRLAIRGGWFSSVAQLLEKQDDLKFAGFLKDTVWLRTGYGDNSKKSGVLAEKLLKCIIRPCCFTFFKKAAGNSYLSLPFADPASFSPLVRSGLMFCIEAGDSFVFVVPDEVKSEYGRLNASFAPDYKLNEEFALAASCAANLYGAMSLSDFASYFKSFSGYSMTEEEISEKAVFIEEFASSLKPFRIEDEHIAANSVCSNGKLSGIMENSAKLSFLPYRTVSKDEALRIALKDSRIGIFDDLNEFLHVAGMSDKERYSFAAYVEEIFQIGRPLTDAYDAALELLDESVNSRRLSQEGMNELMRLLRDARLTVPEFGRRGYSAGELEKALNLSDIGPNEPCLCGSGKKYKKCCGKGK